MLFSVLIRKGPVPRYDHPPRFGSWLRGDTAQLAAGPSGPSSQTLLSGHHWGARCPTQLALRLPQAAQTGRGQVPQVVTCSPLLLGHRGEDGETFTAAITAWAKASGRPWWGHLSPTEHSLQPIPWALQLTHWPKASGEPEGLGESLGPPLISLSMSGSTLHQQMNKSPTKGCSLTAGCLWAWARQKD